jgi:hypothetical protein
VANKAIDHPPFPPLKKDCHERGWYAPPVQLRLSGKRSRSVCLALIFTRLPQPGWLTRRAGILAHYLSHLLDKPVDRDFQKMRESRNADVERRGE